MRKSYIKRYLLTALFCLSTATTVSTVHADTNTLVGHWMCMDKVRGETRNFDVTFMPNGDFQGVITSKIRQDGDKVVIQANYKGLWRLDGNKFHDTPIAAEITHFQMNGKDALDSPVADAVLRTLLEEQGKPAKIRFASPQKFYFFYKGTRTTCKSLGGRNLGS